MIRFDCDYTEGAHPKLLERLVETNFCQTPGYGVDEFCESAKARVRELCACPEAEVHFLVGGTQTNVTVIASILRPYEGVLAASTGHINVHETGAVEAHGHKVLALPHQNGKLTAKMVRDAWEGHINDATHEHMVRPGMVYISHPTENGTLYSLEELTALSETCREIGLPLFLDGARMGYGLMAKGADLTLPDIARLCDVFYIGGTKVGALFGEAVVFPKKGYVENFRYMIKQNGGMLAKGRLLGVQFDTLFADGLYFEIAKHAVTLADKIRDTLRGKGIPCLFETAANQIFPIFTEAQRAKLAETYAFDYWTKVDDDHSAVRICTSWATTEENTAKLIRDLENL
ncbi:MAG: low specificity L-threonine aldolase [Clostridia bacterium]|nr:low specificity L-threonine aldolase [Clostridia bacterium]